MQIAAATPLVLDQPPVIETGTAASRDSALELWTAALASLRAEYLAGAHTGLVRLRQWLERLAADPADLSTRAEVARSFHSYAGSGATYGLPGVTDIGRDGEAACNSIE